jgi:hydroxymethylglutaryl-CoA reductase
MVGLGMTPTSRLPGFYKLPLAERRQVLARDCGLSDDELAAFEGRGGLTPSSADQMVENAVGVLALPLGLGLNFVVNGTPVLVPMAVEEPSVVAACSHVARLAAAGGGFTADADPPRMVGQIQVLDVLDPVRGLAAVRAAKDELAALGNRFCRGLVERGGGVFDVDARILEQLQDGVHADLDGGGAMLVVHVRMNVCDAMGANAVNTVVEGIAKDVERIAGGRVRLRILSNLCDERLARATMRVPYDVLATGDVAGRDVAIGIVESYRLAARDPYRATTHNKGIMNGIDAVAIATGNDWRAIEAGAHAFAARSGRYTSLSSFRLDDDGAALIGAIELPMAVGTVGGSTTAHPTVRACRKILGAFATRADHLAGLMASVGLAQNTAALKALATEGIQRGHMALHARRGLARDTQTSSDRRVSS